MDKVTVIIPSYNHADYIEETINSCLDQSYSGIIEIVIVDDFSSDNTRDILSRFNEEFFYNRVIKVIYKNSNKGLNDSIQVGIDNASGDYIQLLASDDIICKNKIDNQIDFLKKNSNYDCVYSRGYIYDGYNKTECFLDDFKRHYELGKGLEYISKQDWGAPLAQSALFKIDLLKNIVTIRNDYKSDDWAMIIVITKDYSLGYYDIPCFLYRQHNGNTYKKYWNTFPMRIDVASRLVDDKYRMTTLSNIFLSQSKYLLSDGQKLKSIKFFIAANIFNFKLNSLFFLAKFFMPRKLLKLTRLLLRKKYV